MNNFKYWSLWKSLFHDRNIMDHAVYVFGVHRERQKWVMSQWLWFHCSQRQFYLYFLVIPLQTQCFDGFQLLQDNFIFFNNQWRWLRLLEKCFFMKTTTFRVDSRIHAVVPWYIHTMEKVPFSSFWGTHFYGRSMVYDFFSEKCSIKDVNPGGHQSLSCGWEMVLVRVGIRGRGGSTQDSHLNRNGKGSFHFSNS